MKLKEKAQSLKNSLPQGMKSRSLLGKEKEKEKPPNSVLRESQKKNLPLRRESIITKGRIRVPKTNLRRGYP